MAKLQLVHSGNRRWETLAMLAGKICLVLCISSPEPLSSYEEEELETNGRRTALFGLALRFHPMAATSEKSPTERNPRSIFDVACLRARAAAASCTPPTNSKPLLGSPLHLLQYAEGEDGTVVMEVAEGEGEGDCPL
ncbi:hypothetical protein MUK42_21412 [Musa troglodytarum]|uniref:Uncharacterized protein n=1 Tax=Musa troglodytarum TaxID=320322 RepID=A0A9E7G5B0_9LILI|nr:hypothetical protein MUK42_21412 [Musa troglodytarum]